MIGNRRTVALDRHWHLDRSLHGGRRTSPERPLRSSAEPIEFTRLSLSVRGGRSHLSQVYRKMLV
jgi:hypothetical protein